MANETWCFHSYPPTLGPHRLSSGEAVSGLVVCIHPFGVGCILIEREDFGHVNVTELGRATPKGMTDYPLIGERLRLEVLGYSGTGQLRLRVRE